MYSAVIPFLWVLFIAAFAATANAQCAAHPAGMTAVLVANESSFDLTLFIDDEDKGVVHPRDISPEWQVEPGEHLLRARAVVAGIGVWVWVLNDIQAGQLCTWTVTDPPIEIARLEDKYRQ